MKTRLRRISATLLLATFAVMTSVGFARAQDTDPLSSIFDGYRALGSSNWGIKNGVVMQWKAMTDRFKQQQADCQPADGCEKFKALVKSLDNLPMTDQLKLVRQSEKDLPYVEDMKNYDKTDYWATPYEMLSKGSGDAEDYAILSYFALRAAGVPAQALRIIAVRIKTLGGIGHAILAVNTTPEPEVLDNRVGLPVRAALTAREFQPAIGVNEDHWWVYFAKPQ
jgi:predicted transglutaminase-like cysteine proteinase